MIGMSISYIPMAQILIILRRCGLNLILGLWDGMILTSPFGSAAIRFRWVAMGLRRTQWIYVLASGKSTVPAN
jgi:hypothetical protein